MHLAAVGHAAVLCVRGAVAAWQLTRRSLRVQWQHPIRGHGWTARPLLHSLLACCWLVLNRLTRHRLARHRLVLAREPGALPRLGRPLPACRQHSLLLARGMVVAAVRLLTAAHRHAASATVRNTIGRAVRGGGAAATAE